MRRKLLTGIVSGLVLVGGIGVGSGPAGATTTRPTTPTAIDVQAMINRFCAANPQHATLCARLQRLSTAQIDALIARAGLALRDPGTRDAIVKRLLPYRAQICANRTLVETRIRAHVPARHQTKVLQAVARVCANR
jgi:hypothetical protein